MPDERKKDDGVEHFEMDADDAVEIGLITRDEYEAIMRGEIPKSFLNDEKTP